VHVTKAVAHQQLTSDKHDDVIAAALERTVELVARDLQTPPVSRIPSPHVQTRRAA
jgi:hypothetical protein